MGGKSDLSISAEALGELIGGIYEAALEPRHFDTSLDEISRRVNAYSPMILGRSRDGAAGWPVTDGLRPPEVSTQLWKSFLEYYSRIDPLGPVLIRQPPGLYNYASLPGADGYFASEFYNDFSKPAGCAHSAVAWRPLGLEEMLITCFHRDEEGEAFRADEMRFLSMLEPHISRAAQLGLRLRAASDHSDLAEHALHQMNEGVLFVDANGRIVFANRSAERILADADGLASLRGRVRGHDSITHKELRTAIATASGQSSHHERACELAVLRPSGCHPYRVLIAPVAGRRVLRDSAGFSTAMIFIGHADRDFDSRETWLQAAYGLTPTEARLANALVAGHSLQESALLIEIGIGTARGHLKSIFSKMRIGKQSELIRVVLLSTSIKADGAGELMD